MDLILFAAAGTGFLSLLIKLAMDISEGKPKKYSLIGMAICLVLLIVSLEMGPDETEVKQTEVEVEVEAGEEELDPEEVKEPEVNEEPVKEMSEETKIELDKAKIGISIRERIDAGDYRGAKRTKVTVNEDISEGNKGKYIALVYMELDITNTVKNNNKTMRVYSDDLVATLANEGHESIGSVAVFWDDHYNDRDVKYSYTHEEEGFRVDDIAGE